MHFGLRALGSSFLFSLLLCSATAQQTSVSDKTSQTAVSDDKPESDNTDLTLADVLAARTVEAEKLESSSVHPSIAVVLHPKPRKTFDWHAALRQSGTFLAIQQAGLMYIQPWFRWE